jgi:hypothetical protein
LSDLLTIARKATKIPSSALLRIILSRPRIKKFITDLNTEDQLGDKHVNAFNVEMYTVGGEYSIPYAKIKGVARTDIDLNKSGRYWKTFTVIILPNGDFKITSNKEIHGDNTFLSNERWGEVEGLIPENLLKVQTLLNFEMAQYLLSL